MKYFKNENNEAYAYEDNVEDDQIKDGLVSITKEEFDAIVKPSLTLAQKQNDDDGLEFQSWLSAKRQDEEALLRAEWRAETGRPE